jgi:hypothetical protein
MQVVKIYDYYYTGFSLNLILGFPHALPKEARGSVVG